MTATALVVTVTTLLVGGWLLLDACAFLAPYRRWLWQVYGLTWGIWTVVLAANLFGACYLALRAVGLRDTGRKLAHLDRELRHGSPIARELADRLEDR